MKIKYLNKERAEKAKLTKESYEVLAYGQYNETLKTFLFPNDELEIYDMDESSVEIIDSNLSEYERLDNYNGGRELYVKSNLIKYLVEFKSIYEIKTPHLWTQSKLANYFLTNDYTVVESYRKTILDENYKLNLIKGFLQCVNTLLTYKNSDTNIWEEFYFSISNTEFGYLKEKPKFDIQREELPTNEFKSNILKFSKETIPESDINISNELFKLIDSIFIRKINGFWKIYNWYEEVICIEYENKYYSLRKFTGS